MEMNNYIIVSLFLAFLVLFIVSGYESAPVNSTVVTTTTPQNCAGADLNFNYSAQQTPIKAPVGTNTFSVVYVTNNGNVTENISIAVSSNLGLQFIVAKPFLAQIGQKSYTEYEVSSPSEPGNYSAEITLTAAYGSCKNSKSFAALVWVTNSSS